jgi:hypothetical protein
MAVTKIGDEAEAQIAIAATLEDIAIALMMMILTVLRVVTITVEEAAPDPVLDHLMMTGIIVPLDADDETEMTAMMIDLVIRVITAVAEMAVADVVEVLVVLNPANLLPLNQLRMSVTVERCLFNSWRLV